MKRAIKAILSISLLAFYVQGYCDTAPPQEAMAACADKEDGDACEYTNKEGTLLGGFCRINQSSQGKLVCVPSQ